MKTIENLKEKRLLVTRQFLIKKMENTDENIISVWCELFPSDKMRLNDVKLFDWIRKHINSNGIKSCDEQLEKVRHRGLKIIKRKCKHIGYGAKIISQPKNALAKYIIFTTGKKYGGDFEKLCRRMGNIPKIRKDNCK